MIVRLTALHPLQIEPLVEESRREGFRFLVRLRDDWASGTNRFEQPGEGLFGLFADGQLIGVGGVNRQDESTGRLRRFYILPSYRRRKRGSQLLRHILGHAAASFHWVVLRTDTEPADRFYRACGFTRIPGSRDPTHRIELPTTSSQSDSRSPVSPS